MSQLEGCTPPESVVDVDALPVPIREVEHAWIPMSDGVRLACRYWLPRDAETNPVPAIIEYIPYCKRDGTSARDEAMHPYLAAHGYCAIRVDMRGSGESEGVLADEYLKLEQDDALEVIDWIAAQSWCAGKVGMFGKSWGGFNCLQVAARRPSALRAVISVYSTDDRYADDIHTMGGCQLLENPSWSFSMLHRSARPPDPALVGGAWRGMWMQRLEACRPWIIEWLRHPLRDGYWKHGSVCEDYGAIQVPVMAVGGWEDPYTNSVLRLMENLSVPRTALIGPWGHQYPHQAKPEPMAGFLQESLLWWDRWLKGIDSGADRMPMLRAWMQYRCPPMPAVDSRPGRWVEETVWPNPSAQPHVLRLGEMDIVGSPSPETATLPEAPLDLGLCDPVWLKSGSGDHESAMDQRPADMHSLCLEYGELDERLEILGAPKLRIRLSSSCPLAQMSARLCEVGLGGYSQLVSYGVINLAHDPSHVTLSPLHPDETRAYELTLNACAHRFERGSTIRLALAASLWPIVWPAADTTRLTVHLEGSALELPVREAERYPVEPPPPPASARIAPRERVREPEPGRFRIERDLASGRVAYVREEDEGITRSPDNGWTWGGRTRREFAIHPRDPLSASAQMQGLHCWGRAGDLDVEVGTSQIMTAAREHFEVQASVEARESGAVVFERSWSERIPREGF